MQSEKSDTHQTDSHRLSHPTSEEWMASLYGELPPDEAAKLTAHLAECADCRTRFERWKTTKAALADYSLPAARPPQPAPAPFVKWGIAAAFVFGLGLGLGHVLSPAPSISADARAALKSEIASDLTAKLDQYQQTTAGQRAADNQAILAALKQMDSARVADFVSLRKDLEILAVGTQNGLQQAQRELASLTTYQSEFKSPQQ